MKKEPKRRKAPINDEYSKATILLPKKLNDDVVAIAKKAYLNRSSMIRVLLSEAVEARKGK
jgi:metal-responsive CopG/Arc/MetJ family transcriptional regulator